MTTAEAPKTEQHAFEADVSRLLHIMMVHSVSSDKSVFLRELISSAADACGKLRYKAASNPSLISEAALARILVLLTPEARTLAIDDNGIGMTRNEIVEVRGTVESIIRQQSWHVSLSVQLV